MTFWSYLTNRLVVTVTFSYDLNIFRDSPIWVKLLFGHISSAAGTISRCRFIKIICLFLQHFKIDYNFSWIKTAIWLLKRIIPTGMDYPKKAASQNRHMRMKIACLSLIISQIVVIKFWINFKRGSTGISWQLETLWMLYWED